MMSGPLRGPIGKAATSCDSSLRLMLSCFPNVAGPSGYVSIAAMPGNPETDMMGH